MMGCHTDQTLERRLSGPTTSSTTNCYIISDQNTSVYAGGSAATATSAGAWSVSIYDLYFKLFPEAGIIVWKATQSFEPFTRMAVTAIQTLGTGSINYYVSDDGTNWTQILALNTAQAVNFTTNNVYLKAVIAGDATLDAVAWGGY